MKVSKKLITLDSTVFIYLGLYTFFFFALSTETEVSAKAMTRFDMWLALTPFLMAGFTLLLGIFVNIFYFRANNKITYPLLYAFTLTSLLIGITCLFSYLYLI